MPLPSFNISMVKCLRTGRSALSRLPGCPGAGLLDQGGAAGGGLSTKRLHAATIKAYPRAVLVEPYSCSPG